MWSFSTLTKSCFWISSKVSLVGSTNIRVGEDVLKLAKNFRLLRRLQDVSSWKHLTKTSWRCLGRRLANMTWRRHGRWEIVTLKTSSRHLGKQEMFAGKSFLLFTFQPKLMEWDYWKTFRLKILKTMRGISKMCSNIHTSSHRRCSVKKGVLKNFTGKHQSLFNKNNFNKKRLQHRCFPVKFAIFLRTSILKNICE